MLGKLVGALILCLFFLDRESSYVHAFMLPSQFCQNSLNVRSRFANGMLGGSTSMTHHFDSSEFDSRSKLGKARQSRIQVRPTTVTVHAQVKSEMSQRKVQRAVSELEELLKTVTALTQRPIDGGCPWTAEQRALDVLGYVKAEVDEIEEELKLGPSSPHYALLSELGDLLFCSFLLIKLCERDKLGNVSLAGAAAFASAKVRRRAPFVFSPQEDPPFPNTLLTGAEASDIWKRIKSMEKAGLIPICPDGYDYVNGACLLSYEDLENGTAAEADIAAEERDSSAANFSDTTKIAPLLLSFAAGIAVGVTSTTWIHHAS